MPNLVRFHKTPLLSIVEFDNTSGEQVFLTYTHGRENGPLIERSGRGSPTMESVRPAYPGEVTTDPWAQRFGTWLIQEDLRSHETSSIAKEQTGVAAELRRVQGELRTLRRRGDSPQRVTELEARVELLQCRQEMLTKCAAENRTVPAHDKEFIVEYPDHVIVGQQGCGDLTMNLWNVAYINSPLALGGKPTLIFSHQEPLSRRTYSCFVKWKQTSKGPPRLTIEDVRFDPNVKSDNEKVWCKVGNRWTPSGDDIEFAFSNQQVIRAGAIVDISRGVHEFSDLRHLVKMVNLNPDGPLFSGDPGRPRFYFGEQLYDDVWFGEAQLIRDRNLQRAAMWGPIFLSRLYDGLGASVDQVRNAMTGPYGGYAEVTDPRRDLQQGEFRFLPEDENIVEVYLWRSTYRWSMLGLDESGEKVYFLACDGNPATRTGYVLEQAAEELLAAGADDALLIDEGQDVFQKALLGHSSTPKAQVAGGGVIDLMVELRRTRLRATLIVARRKDSKSPEVGARHREYATAKKSVKKKTARNAAAPKKKVKKKSPA